MPETSLAILISPHPVVLRFHPASICFVIFYYLVKHVISVTHTLFIHPLPFWKSLIKTCWFYSSGGIMEPAYMWCLPQTPCFKVSLFCTLSLYFSNQPTLRENRKGPTLNIGIILPSTYLASFHEELVLEAPTAATHKAWDHRYANSSLFKPQASANGSRTKLQFTCDSPRPLPSTTAPLPPLTLVPQPITLPST